MSCVRQVSLGQVYSFSELGQGKWGARTGDHDLSANAFPLLDHGNEQNRLELFLSPGLFLRLGLRFFCGQTPRGLLLGQRFFGVAELGENVVELDAEKLADLIIECR